MGDPYATPIAGLEAREQVLLGEISERKAELRRIRQAIAVLCPERRVQVRNGTYELLDDYAASLPPGTPVTASSAMAYADRHGWETRAASPLQAMRIALANRVRIGAIQRQASGYRTLTEDEAAARTAELAERPVMRPGPKPRYLQHEEHIDTALVQERK
jgi:hypothetical protein